MTIKQHGGVFGRNPKFNNVEVESLSIAGNAVPDASTILVDGDIGSTVQGYDADTAKLDVAQTFTAAQTFNENIVMANTKGIDFSATAGTGTSELFDDYEEGTWTPAIQPNGTGTAWTATVSGTYTKAGRLVFLTGSIAYSVKVDTGFYAYMTGLPFTPSATSNWNYISLQQDTSNTYQLSIETTPRGRFYKNNAPGTAGPLVGSELGPATGTISFSLCYEI